MSTPSIRSLIERASAGEAITDEEIEAALAPEADTEPEDIDELLASIVDKLGPPRSTGMEHVTIGSASIVDSLRSKFEGRS